MGLVKKISAWIFRSWGWSVEGPLPYDVPKCVVVVYPHTSNWDFPVGILFREVYDLDIGFVGKHSLFKPPLGWLMRRLGGKPVVRTGNTKFVEGVVKVFERNEVFRLCLTPEGTRSRVDKLKSGFHFMALAAGVPIVWCAFHWDTKTMRWSEPYQVTEDYQETLAAFHDFFRGTLGYSPGDAYPIPTADNSQVA
jgi:1-acyl-sn-glycerol-3-phosphate acyltransferase